MACIFFIPFSPANITLYIADHFIPIEIIIIQRANKCFFKKKSISVAIFFFTMITFYSQIIKPNTSRWRRKKAENY